MLIVDSATEHAQGVKQALDLCCSLLQADLFLPPHLRWIGVVLLGQSLIYVSCELGGWIWLRHVDIVHIHARVDIHGQVGHASTHASRHVRELWVHGSPPESKLIVQDFSWSCSNRSPHLIHQESRFRPGHCRATPYSELSRVI